MSVNPFSQNCQNELVDYEMSATDLKGFFEKAFQMRASDRNILLISDLPQSSESAFPLRHISMAYDWAQKLTQAFPEHIVEHYAYQSPLKNNGPLPEQAYSLNNLRLNSGSTIASLTDLETLGVQPVPLQALLKESDLLIALGWRSATSPLKKLAKTGAYRFRGASMPGVTPGMTEKFQLDWLGVQEKCEHLKELLQNSDTAELLFKTPDEREYALTLDLKGQEAVSSPGIIAEPNMVGNLPGGETYIVPFEGSSERVSRSNGFLPVEIASEIVVFKIEANKIVSVVSENQESQKQRKLLLQEPAYGNIAELGLGVLASFGVEPSADAPEAVILNEKLGLHIAFGLSDHFPGGTVGLGDFKDPQRAIHIDWVYHPSSQPSIAVQEVVLKQLDASQVDIRPLLLP